MMAAKIGPVRFSICIPIWNDSSWLRGAIESVVQQTYREWDLVVSDNASDEDLAVITHAFADGRVRHHRWEDHVGTYENHNRAMDLSGNPWIIPLGSDDRLRSNALSVMARRIVELRAMGTEPTLVVAGAARVDVDGRSAERRYYGSQGRKEVVPGLYDATAWLRVMTSAGVAPWNIGSIAFRRQALVDSGGAFRPEVGLSADNELVLRLATYGPVDYIAQDLLDFTVRPESDGNRRFMLNRSSGERQTPMGAALVSAFAAYEARGLAGPAERRLVARAIARLHLQRAGQHRILAGGRGWRGAAEDVARAVRAWPGLLASPSAVLRAAGVLLAPRALIRSASGHLARSPRNPAEAG